MTERDRQRRRLEDRVRRDEINRRGIVLYGTRSAAEGWRVPEASDPTDGPVRPVVRVGASSEDADRRDTPG